MPIIKNARVVITSHCTRTLWRHAEAALDTGDLLKLMIVCFSCESHSSAMVITS